MSEQIFPILGRLGTFIVVVLIAFGILEWFFFKRKASRNHKKSR